MDRATQHAAAWLALAGALALHVADEATHDFLSVYNPSVAAIRERIPWLPLPTFTFGPWLAGLAAGVCILILLAPFVRRGNRGLLYASFALGVLMTCNGLGHLTSSLWMGRAMPGVYSSPVLIAASLWLLLSAWRRRTQLTAR